MAREMISVSRMLDGEAAETHSVFEIVVKEIGYYNQRAKCTELKKYSLENISDINNPKNGFVLVAREFNSIAGFCIAKHDDDLIWLSWYGIHPSFRGRGIARLLLTALDKTAKEVGSHKIWCDSIADNKESAHILSGCGYQKLCDLKNHWYGQDYFLWDKAI